MIISPELWSKVLYLAGVTAVIFGVVLLTARFRRSDGKCRHGRIGDCTDCWYHRQY